MAFFTKEIEFEKALTEHLLNHGWNEVIMNPTEEDLVKNWAQILFDNNREIDKLGKYPLTNSEMQQVIDAVNMCDSPYQVNAFINGEQVCIKRDNEQDTNNYGKEVYLKIFDAKEISSGQSRYQIVRQPRFKTASEMSGDRRGDVMLLINGMPVIHIELKRSKVDVSQAAFQIKRYTHEGIFSNGIFKMIQIFVAMTPTETVYFANPGKEENFNPQFYFHWENFNNTVIGDWQQVATDLLSIPMAHQMVGFYTIADDKDKTLKVLRSYQYFAVSAISDRVRQTNWDDHKHHGGYIWHTTGSGKTMTSFKSAQLIAESGDADKVVFLLDRIELSIQSLDEFRGFADDPDSVQETSDATVLLNKLKSTDKDDRLIVSSIQKMYNLRPDKGYSKELLAEIGKKRLVFIVDECHRSVFGEMLVSIKHTFPRALLFGFTGTPVFEENAKNEITTETLFGDMLHKYTIASGIPDGNVLGFDPYMVTLHDENELRELVALHEIGVESVDDIGDDEEKKKNYDKFMDELQMEDTYTENGKQVHGIEHYLPKDLYKSETHHLLVAQDIVESRNQLSRNGKFHAILATKNIPEAIEYYNIFKEKHPQLNVAAVFDNNIDNSDGGIAKEDALVAMLTDYNAKYNTSFQIATYGKYKKDVAKRLAHKKPYTNIEEDHSQQIDLLIVVTQMLTGYDSKWVNTLYVDKVMKYVDVIQAFSRTNRLFGPEKPFGTIKYYTYPYTMKQNINDALEVYVDRPLGVFVDKLETNLNKINGLFNHISEIFKSHGINNFEKLPDTREDRNMFAKDFSEMTHLLEAAKLQGFRWEEKEYEFQHGDHYVKVAMEIDEQTYLVLLQRYRELFEGGGGGNDPRDPWEYTIDTFITETGTGTIDAEYINSKFVRFIKNLYTEGPGSDLTKKALQELSKSFASMSQEDQKTALVVLHDIQRGDLRIEFGKTIYDYVNDYQARDLKKLIMNFSEATGVNPSQLENIINSGVDDNNLNDFNRFENLKLTLDMVKTRAFLEKIEGKTIKPFLVAPKADKVLREFILNGVKREQIMNIYNGYTTNEASPEPEEQEVEEFNLGDIKPAIKAILNVTLADVKGNMRPMDEIVDSVFMVLGKKSIETLDSVGIYINRAFANLYAKEPNIIDKSVAFNLLVTKFEAYLKKLYYMVNGEEVKPQFEGGTPSLKEVLHGIPALWNLKYSHQEKYTKLYGYLNMIKSWRNNESHISPTASEQELDAAISVIITMYFYATGSNITELEMAGYDMEADSQVEIVEEALRKLENIEDDRDIRNLIYNRLQMDATISDGELQREVIDEYGTRYPGMSLNDWRHLIEAYTPMVRTATEQEEQAQEIPMQPQQFESHLDMAAENEYPTSE